MPIPSQDSSGGTVFRPTDFERSVINTQRSLRDAVEKLEQEQIALAKVREEAEVVLQELKQMKEEMKYDRQNSTDDR